jgi:hypothetical protein
VRAEDGKVHGTGPRGRRLRPPQAGAAPMRCPGPMPLRVRLGRGPVRWLGEKGKGVRRGDGGSGCVPV